MSAKSRERREKFAKLQEAREVEGLVKRIHLFDNLLQTLKPSVERDRAIQNLHYEMYMKSGDESLLDTLPKESEATDAYRLIRGAMVIDATNLLSDDMAIEFDRAMVDFDEARKHLELPGVSKLPVCPPDYMTFIEWSCPRGKYGVNIALSEASPNPGKRTHSGFATAFFQNRQDLVAFGKSYDIDLFEDHWESAGKHDPAWEFIVPFAISVLRFISAHNVVLLDGNESPKDSADYHRHFGTPLVKYKVAALYTVSNRTDESRKPQQQFDIMPLHGVRGHMRYAPDHPLPQFRKPMYIPPHVRGSEKNGIVVKDYKVQP